MQSLGDTDTRSPQIFQQQSTIPGGVIIQVSTTFFPSAILPGANNQSPDLILASRDSVFFYCHRQSLLSRSTNSFGGFVPPSPSGSSSSATPADSTARGGHALALPTYRLSEDGAVVNLILHIIYNLSSRRFAPTLSDISDALRSLDRYGIPTPDDHAEIWTEVLRHGEAEPIRAYALAASHGVDTLCVRLSPYTLGAELSQLSEADALTMGPAYLRKLFFLHLGRSQALKRVVDRPPLAHEPDPSPSSSCSPEDAARVVRGWELAVANILVHPSPQNVSPEELRKLFGTVVSGGRRMCPRCLDGVHHRVDEVVQDWRAVKTTI